jgi:hypothetical protein
MSHQQQYHGKAQISIYKHNKIYIIPYDLIVPSIYQPDLSTGLLIPYTDELFSKNDVFNELILDIEKYRFLFLFRPSLRNHRLMGNFIVLSESQSLQALEIGVRIDGTPMLNGGSQQAGLWWFSLD